MCFVILLPRGVLPHFLQVWPIICLVLVTKKRPGWGWRASPSQDGGGKDVRVQGGEGQGGGGQGVGGQVDGQARQDGRYVVDGGQDASGCTNSYKML